jgi:serine/threonine protein kinase
MKTDPCPTEAELLQYFSDELQPWASDRVAAHIATCEDCESATAALCNDPELSDLAESLKRMQHGGQWVATPPALVERLYKLPLTAKDTVTADLEATGEIRPEEPGRSAGSGSRKGRSKPAELPGSVVFGQYQLTRELGHGGMGVVYEGTHVSLKRRFAVKLLLNDRMNSDQAVERFHHEMEAIGQLDHPNIVRATDAGEIDEIPFLAMEFVDGVDLSRIVAKVGPLSVADTCEVLCQAASGLQHVHDNGLVHRDIKPSNLLLTTTDQVKIVDLGLARLTQSKRSASGLTETGITMGTIAYMSPEQAMSTRDAGPRADQYSLACVLYFLLTGKPVFVCESQMKTMLAHRDQPVPSLGDERPDVPKSLDQVFQRMLSKEPQDRYESLLDVIQDVQETANSGETRFSDNLRSAVPKLLAEQGATSTN